MAPTWRLDTIAPGRLAWLYLKARPEHWTEQSAGAHDAGYWITEETQSLVDDDLGACLRYLCIETDDKHSIDFLEASAQVNAFGSPI